MNLLFISSGKKEVSTKYGGAVETLICEYLRKNEINKIDNIDVYSIYSKNAEEESKKYKYTKFIFVRKNIFYYINKIYYWLFNKLTGKYAGNAYINIINNNLKKINKKYDHIIVENDPYFGLVLNRYNNLILHLHNDFLNKDNKQCDKIFDTYNKIITISNYINDRVRTIKDDPKVVTVYNGIDLNKFNNKKNKISNNIKKILYIGRIVPEKGVLELAQATNNMKNIDVIVAGDGNKKYIRKVKKANVNIKFKGFIPYDKINELYAEADICIIPSIWEEPFALTLIEAMASRKAVIVTNSKATMEITDNESCIIIDKKDIVNNLKKAIIKLVEDDEFRELLGTKALQKVQKFSNDKYYENLREEIIKGE